jgi:apolipoprotein N-acyltransferase
MIYSQRIYEVDVKTKYILLSLLSALLLAFSHPNFIEMGLKTHTFFFIWFAYTPLLYVLMKEDGLKRVFVYGMITGTVFYMIGLYWLCYVKPMGIGAYICWALLALYFSLYMGGTLVLPKLLNERYRIDYLLSIPAVFTILEFVREWFISGWQILTPAQSQYQFLPFLQLLSITGVYGPAFIILFVNTLLAALVINRKTEIKQLPVVISVCICFVLVLCSIAANFKGNKDALEKFKAAIIQPNNDQDVVWSKDYKDNLMNDLSAMIRSLAAEKPGLIVWPETEYPGLLNSEPRKAPEIAGWLPGAYNLVGSDSIERRADNDSNYYNSAYLVDTKGAITASYSKVHLVPFGEYIPLQNAIPFLRAVVRRAGYYGFSAGSSIEPMDMNGIKIGPLICYDSLFPEIAREYARKGAVLLTHLSYEAWYGRTPATTQIFINTAMRAVENGLPIVRSVSTGMSGFIDSRGNIYSETGLFEKRAVAADIYIDKKHRKTIYTRFGDWFPYFLALLLAGISFTGAVRKNDSARNGH